jgi:Na+/H+-dicarboxylate symporter
MADDMYLQIVVFAIFTGIVMNYLPEETRGLRELNKQLASITFKMIEWIVRLAPLAVFGFVGAMVGTTGLDVIVSLTKLVGLVIAACFLQYVVFGTMIAVFGRISPFPFYRKMITTQVMAFSTSSSKATLTTAMRELQDKLGVSQGTSQFMMPLGACINMDGTAIYLGICSMFFAQMYGIDLDAMDYLMLVLTCTMGSIGAAGIPSGSIIFMGMVLSSVGIPIEGIAIILGVDRILDMFRTTVNITGDAAVTLIIDRTENQLDVESYYAPVKD